MAKDFSEAFYHSKKWKDMRAYILIRDKYKCQRCGSSGPLEVHHIKHLNPENVHDASISLNDANLITLCRDCHFAEHAEERAKHLEEYNRSRKPGDCSEEYVFDAAGFLVPKQKD